MFGSEKRAKRRAKEALEAAQLVAMQRSNRTDAIREVMSAASDTTLMVGSSTLRGHNGACSISMDTWHGIGYLWLQVLEYRKTFGRGYTVTAEAWAHVSVMSAGLAMDMASGYSNPRLHAQESRTVHVTIANEADVETHRRSLHNPSTVWIIIRKK